MRRWIGKGVSSLAGIAAVSVTLACGSSGDEGEEPPEGPQCADSEVLENGECVLDPFRFEPEQQLDADNIIFYDEAGDGLTLLELPPPPKSGFRAIAEPQEIDPGFDSENGINDGGGCQAWEIPNDLNHRWVYTAVIHSTPGLHHANLYGLPIGGQVPEQPYPYCTTSADGLIFGQLFPVLQGADTSMTIVPEVLFASSTQVIGVSAERFAFADGYAYEVPEDFQIVTDLHLQNTTPDKLRVEAAWDFYTMPIDKVTHPSKMFVYIFFNFLLPPREESTLKATCNWGGGDVLGIMPHTHQWATQFDVKFGNSPLKEYQAMMAPEVLDDGTHLFDEMLVAYDRAGTGQTDSDIEVYDPVIDTNGMNAVQFSCHYNNTTDHDMCFGVNENEMCFLFGYTSPPEAQRVGVALGNSSASCITFDPTDRFTDRGRENPFSLNEWIGVQPQKGLEEIIGAAAGCGLPGFL